MLPNLSMAMLPIQRWIPSLVFSVPCWKTVGVPLGVRISYQRTLVIWFLLLVPTATEWLTNSDSTPPRFRYARRYIRRSASESSLFDVLGCGIQVPPPEQAALNAATAILVGPVKVVFAELAKSTWTFHRLSELAPKFMKKFGEPAGGAVVPSRSEGSKHPKLLLSWKHCCVAAQPANIAVRSRAQTLLPAKV